MEIEIKVTSEYATITQTIELFLPTTNTIITPHTCKELIKDLTDRAYDTTKKLLNNKKGNDND